MAEQARQQEAQTLMFQEMRQHQEAVRLQLFQQQQMLQYYSGYFGALYSHVKLVPPPPAPLPSLDPAAPTGPAASLPQTPLGEEVATSGMTPRVFGYSQQTPMTPDKQRQFLEQQQQFQDFQ